MRTFISLFVIAVPVFLIIDLVWLGVIARPFYKAQLGPLMRPDVDWVVAFIFYGIYVAGIVFFAVQPAVAAASLGKALLLGGALGFVAYATYDLTNLAVMAGFPRTMAIVDIIWGTVLTASVSGVTFLIYRSLS